MTQIPRILILTGLLVLASAGHAADDIDAALRDILDARDDNAGGLPSSQGSALIDQANIPNIFIAGEFFYEKDLKDSRPEAPSRPSQNNLDMREIEFGFSGAVDHTANATVVFALHRETDGDEEGEIIFDLHEAYLEFTRLPANFYLKLGKMFPDAGRLNNRHRHDWDFASSPVVHDIMFNDTQLGEGASDIGAELSYLMPWAFYQELKVGAFRGRSFGHTHADGSEKADPLYSLRLKNFLPISDRWGTQFGFSYLRYNNTSVKPPNKGDVDHTAGFDLSLKYDQGRQRSFIWSSEFWYRLGERDNRGDDNEEQGFYTYLQQQINHWDIGLRYDMYQRTKFANPVLSDLKPRYDGQTAWVTWHPSEFSYYRLSLERHNPNVDFEHPRHAPGEEAFSLTLQAVFMLGYHQPHQY